MASTRRLAAILAADVAGYSRLMGADEEGTHERLRAHFAELIHPKIEEHRGRVVKNTGDGLLAEFASVVDAVRCAVEMQRGVAERNSATPSRRVARISDWNRVIGERTVIDAGEIGCVAWVTPKEAAAMLTQPADRQLVATIFALRTDKTDKS